MNQQNIRSPNSPSNKSLLSINSEANLQPRTQSFLINKNNQYFIEYKPLTLLSPQSFQKQQSRVEVFANWEEQYNIDESEASQMINQERQSEIHVNHFTTRNQNPLIMANYEVDEFDENERQKSQNIALTLDPQNNVEFQRIQYQNQSQQEQMIKEDQKFELVNANLSNFPLSITKQTWLKIKILNLSRNLITEFPDQIIKMINLKAIILNFNQIQALPQNIDQLKFLETLEVSQNKLNYFKQFKAGLPDSLDKLSKLKRLNISFNFIEQISFHNLITLQELLIQQNAFANLPQQFGKILQNLKYLELEWFKYTKPACSNPSIQKKLERIFRENQIITFKIFIESLSMAPINYKLTDYKERNFIHSAALSEELGVIKGFGEISPDLINQKDLDNNTPLSVSYLENKLKSIQTLLKIGCQFSQQSIFTICARSDYQNFMNYLIQYGFAKTGQEIPQIQQINPDKKAEKIINTQNSDGNTLLHLIFFNFGLNPLGAQKICNWVLFLGAKCNIMNKDQWTPVHIAVKRNQITVEHFTFFIICKALQWIQKYNKNIQLMELQDEHNYTIEVSSDKIFDLEKPGGKQQLYPIHLAAIYGYIDILCILNEMNVNFFSLNHEGRQAKEISAQSLTVLKYMRTYEIQWCSRNILRDSKKNQYREQGKNKYHEIEINLPMKNEIQKNMNEKQKMMNEVEEINSEDILQTPNSQSELNCDIQSSPSESGSPNIGFQFKRNIGQAQDNLGKFSVQSNVPESSRQSQKGGDPYDQEFQDHLPEILRHMRKFDFQLALSKAKQKIQADDIPIQERIKFLNILLSHLTMRSFYILNEFQGIDRLNESEKEEILKNIHQFEQEKYPQFLKKLDFQVQQCKLVVNSVNHNWQKILEKKWMNPQIQFELYSRLSPNLSLDISNSANMIPVFEAFMSHWLYTLLVVPCSQIQKQAESNRLCILDYEVYHKDQNMKYFRRFHLNKIQQNKKKKLYSAVELFPKNQVIQMDQDQTGQKKFFHKTQQKEEDLSDFDLIEVEESIKKYQQFSKLNTPFYQDEHELFEEKQ